MNQNDLIRKPYGFVPKKYRVQKIYAREADIFMYQCQEWVIVKKKFWPWEKDKWAWENMAAQNSVLLNGVCLTFKRYPMTCFHREEDAVKFINSLMIDIKPETVYSV